MAKKAKQNKRKLEEIVKEDDSLSPPSLSSEEEFDEEALTENNENSEEHQDEEQSLNNCIIFDFRNSKSLIECAEEIASIRNLNNNYILSQLKQKLISIILEHVKNLMKENFNNELMGKFEDYLNNNLESKKSHGNTRFFIKKNSEDEMNLLFFESLEEIAQGWTTTGLNGIVNEPVQCQMTGNNGKTMDFESSFIIIYAKTRIGKKFDFKYLICKNTDSGDWSFVGGKKSNPSETSLQCCLREMREELYGYSLDSIEENVKKNGPVTAFENNYIYSHEIEWNQSDNIVNNLLENYKKLKDNNELMMFNSKEISQTLSQSYDFLNEYLELLNKYEFTNEICDYKFINARDLLNERGGRSLFMKRLHRMFVAKIAKKLNKDNKKKKTKKVKKKK